MDTKASSDYNTEDFKDPDSSWVVHEEPERHRSQWVVLVGVVAVICAIAWFLQTLWDSSSVVEDPPVAQQNPVPEPLSDETVSDDIGSDQPPIVADQPLVSLFDDWNGTAGAMILRGVPSSSQPENVVAMTVVGDRVNRFPTPPDSTSRPLWLSADGQIVAFSYGAGRSNQGAWSWITGGDTTIPDPMGNALWSVSHQRRELAHHDLTGPIVDYELDSQVERVLGRLDNGFLVVRSLDSGGSEFAIWTDDGAIVSIDGLAGREILEIGSSTVLLRASTQRFVAMDLSVLGTVTTKASVNVDFDIHQACLSPDETLVAVLGTARFAGTARFTVIEMDSGLERIYEPFVDDFTWTTSSNLVFTRRNSLLASDLDSDPSRIAELAPDYSWQVASSNSVC